MFVAMLVLLSNTFTPDAFLPKSAAYAQCSGANVSPELHWSAPPAGTKSFALTVWDPDAPVTGGWWHWVLMNIPASTRTIAAGASAGEAGTTSFNARGYGGPCPPPGKPHHYRFTLYALDVARIPEASATTRGPELVRSMSGHILQQTVLVGLYKT